MSYERAIKRASACRPIQSHFSFTLLNSQHIANTTSILLFSPEKKGKMPPCFIRVQEHLCDTMKVFETLEAPTLAPACLNGCCAH